VINKIKNRLGSEQGFTLIELLVVIVILGILVAIAVPAYLSFRGNAQDAAAESNVRSAIPAAESYYQTVVPNSYNGLNGAMLRTQAPGVSQNVAAISLNGDKGYCIEDQEAVGHVFSYLGGDPGAPTSGVKLSTITRGSCATNDGSAAAAA
jgi:type IV pilus assembly protein PilA